MRPLRHSLATLAVLALVATGCSDPFASDKTRVTATFDDVIDLVPGSGVRLNDVTVGTVDTVALTEDNRAEVTMAIDPDQPVPAEVEAMLARTSVLGERYVDLVPTSDSPDCCIADGTIIAQTSMRADLENLVNSGAELLITVSSDAVGTSLRTAAEAFGGNSDLISGFVDEVSAVVSTFDDSSDDLLALIDALDAVTAAYAPGAASNAAVMEDLRVATAALQDLDGDLLDTLDDLTVLSDEAVAFLEPHQGEIADTVRRLRKVLQNVEEADADVQRLLEIGPRWMTQLRRGALNEEAQVWLDVIVCGVNDTDGDVSRDCTPPNPGQRTPNPPYYPVPEKCYTDPDPCRGTEG